MKPCALQPSECIYNQQAPPLSDIVIVIGGRRRYRHRHWDPRQDAITIMPALGGSQT
jgi:hypothetical protein